MMSDTIKASEAEQVVENQEPKKVELKKEVTNDKNYDSDKINEMIENKLSSIKELYETKIDTLKSQLKGQDRKNTELAKQLKNYENEKLTEQERFELEKRELAEQRQNLYREKAVAMNDFMLTEEDAINIGDYLYGETEEEIINSAKSLRDFINRKVQAGIEKGVEERIKAGYKPGGAGLNKDGEKDYTQMSKEELRQEAVKAAKMPSGPEKNRILKDLAKAQDELFKR
jgi:hypothetical protein